MVSQYALSTATSTTDTTPTDDDHRVAANMSHTTATTRAASTHARLQPQGSVSLSDFRNSMAGARATLTQVRGTTRRRADDAGPKPDFITFVSLASEIYQAHHDDLVPVQHFQPALETYQGKGHTSLVTHAAITRSAPSAFARGVISSFNEGIVIKRPRDIRLEKASSGLISFITELRIRFHPTLRSHPHIARLRGIGWDFEDEDATVPRPILLEEFAPQGALDNFWKNWNFVRMNFKSKLEFCRDLADGLRALHSCGVVHGDVKPANILVFPRPDSRDSFVVKLTDFGHSVIESDRQGILPAFTPQWCAPEATRDDDSQSMTFQELKATDVYSYGLVVLSIMIGRSFYLDYKQTEDIQRHKQAGTLLQQSVEQVEKEDKECMDSDLEVGTVAVLLRKTIQRDPRLRSLSACIAIIDRYELETQTTTSRIKFQADYQGVMPVGPLEVGSKVTVGYQTMACCSHQLKARIAHELESIALNPLDARRPAAEWELAICHFSGFGVPKDFAKSHHWLSLAHEHGVVAAQQYRQPLCDAMGISTAVPPKQPISEKLEDVNSEPVPNPYSDPWKVIPEEPEPDQCVSEENGSLTASDDHEGESDSTPTWNQTPLSSAVVSIVAHDTLDELIKVLHDEPAMLNRHDGDGNTILILAAKHKRYDVLSHLLDHTDVDTATVNKFGQTVLHHMTSFKREELDEVLPKLIRRGADIAREALPSRNESDQLLFSLGIRCCPVLNAVLHNDVVLLDSLLKASHADGLAESACRVCEAGSGFRRILAVSFSLFHADVIDILIKHLQTIKSQNDGDHAVDLDRVEVWAGPELLPLHKVPFSSVAVAAMDLPECFFRAMTLGKAYQASLNKIIQFLLKTTGVSPESRAYSMLLAAVKSGSLDAVELLLEDAGNQGRPVLWWLEAWNQTTGWWDLSSTPLCTSVTLGHRQIFDRLLRDDQSFFRRNLEFKCLDRDCSGPEQGRIEYLFRLLFGLQPDRVPQHTHEQRLAREILAAAATARHQDSHFLSYTMAHVNTPLIVDEDTGPQLLGRAILNSSFKAATVLATGCPELWSTNGSLRGFDMPYSFWLNNTDLFSGSTLIDGGTVVDLVLHSGSYEQCQFVLEHLLPLRTASTSSASYLANLRSRFTGDLPGCRDWLGRLKTKPFREPGANDDAMPPWYECPLTRDEYLTLLSGNILRSRANRRGVWDIIEAQANTGHPRSIPHLKDAIGYGNVEAVREMLNRGWPVQSHRRFFALTSWSSLLHMDFLMKSSSLRASDGLIEAMEEDSPPQIRVPDAGTHREIYDQYLEYHSTAIQRFHRERLREIRQLLVDRGAQKPKAYLNFTVAFSQAASETLQAWALICYVLVYLVVLPIALVYGTTDTWTSMTHGQKVGFSYLWSALAGIIGAFATAFVEDEDDMGWAKGVIVYTIYAILFVGNHFALPYAIIRLNWSPLFACSRASIIDGALVQSCTNYSFLMPIAIFVFELIGGSLLLIALD